MIHVTTLMLTFLVSYFMGDFLQFQDVYILENGQITPHTRYTASELQSIPRECIELEVIPILQEYQVQPKCNSEATFLGMLLLCNVYNNVRS